MLHNLSKLKQIQEKNAEIQKLAKDQNSKIQNAFQIIANQPSIKDLPPIDLQMPYSIGFTNTYEKVELQQMENQRKRYLENINHISKYNHPFFVQYVGTKIQQEKQQNKKLQQSMQAKKQIDKKMDRNLQITKKQPLRKQDQNKQKEKQDKQQVNEPQQSQSKYKLHLLMEEYIQKFDLNKYKKQIKSKSQFMQRLSLASDIIESMSSLNDLQYTIYPANLEDLLTIKKNRIKLGIHTVSLWRTISQDQVSETKIKQLGKFKKQNMVNPSLRYTSPQFTLKSVTVKDIRYNDVWKTGVLILTLMIGENLSKDLLTLESVDQTKLKEFKVIDQSKVSKMNKYFKNQDVAEIMKMVSIMPSDRPLLKNYRSIFKRIRQQMSESINLQTLQLAKQHYQKQRNQKNFKFMPQLKTNQELLTQDHRKKLAQYFKTNQNRALKDYKLIYRASQTQFSCKAFYQVAYEKKCLLIVFCQKANNKKLIFFSQETFDIMKCNGVFGGFIKDAKKLSFIYSPQENQFCKLKNAQRAIGVSHIHGPIIGDGDIVISDGGLYNICKFPSSYQSLKLKRLLKAQKIEISQYDVYQVVF